MRLRLVDLGTALADENWLGEATLDTELAPSTVPLALLPVRLETRFFPINSDLAELRVRIFPDQIHLDAHDPRLTADEVDWARRYWLLDWHAGDDLDRRRRAWQMIADRFDPERAAWMARAQQPANPDDRPDGGSDDESELPRPPRFPEPGPAPERAATPVARLMPDRWIAIAVRDGAVVATATGADVTADPPVGPDLAPELAPPQLDDEHHALDAGLDWLVDFDAAEKRGMALRMPLPGLGTLGVDALLVLGVRATGPADGARQLGALLDAHRFTDGLGLLAPGIPTNNAVDQRSGFTSRDPRQEKSFATEWLGDPVRPGTDAALMGDALGLGPDTVDATLRRLAGAGRRDDELAAAMQTAIWPATWGYYLSQMIGLGTTGITLGGLDWVRRHAVDRLRPGGALPLLRVGRQPYGLLPVTCTGRWTPPADDDTGPALALRNLLVTLRAQVWRDAAGRVARLGGSDDANLDVVALLRDTPQSTAVRTRRLMGRTFARYLREFLGEGLDAAGFWTRFDQLTGAAAARLGLPATFLATAVYEPDAASITASLVQDSPADPAQPAPAALTPNYIAALSAADPDALAAQAAAERVPLLHALLRHGLLREHAVAAALLLGGPNAAGLLRDPELVDVVPGAAASRTWAGIRAQTVPGSTPAMSVRDRLRQPGLADQATRSLAEFGDALGLLVSATPSDLQRHLRNVLDASAFRLDAWIGSLAARRQAEVRAAQPTGIVVGGYGWVENLRPDDSTGTSARTVPVVDGEPGPLVLPAEDPGFLFAPSLGQAATAAVLRNAHLAQGESAGSAFAISLPSDRVRSARRLFDGVRQGQPLGALLGYDVERRLQQAGVPEFIDDLRRLAPRPGIDPATTRAVVDGLRLRELATPDPAVVLDQMPGLAAPDPRREKLRKVLAALDDQVDAVADAVTAEGAYQLVRGNLTRAASLSAIADGSAPPPSLDFLATPRGGTGLTHRVVLLLDADRAPAVPPGWAGPDVSARAAAEPVLNAWAGRMFGSAAGVVCRVAVQPPDGASTSIEIGLPDLGLAPIDLLWARGASATESGELEQRVLDATRARIGADAVAATMTVDLGRRPGAPATERSVSDLLTLGSTAQQVLAAGRALDGTDLLAPHADRDRSVDLADLVTRVERAAAALDRCLQTLESAVATPDAGSLRSGLLAAAGFGVTGALPAASDAPTLAAQAVGVLAELTRRQTAARAAEPDPGADPEAVRTASTERLAAVFGPEFRILPLFRCTDPAPLDGCLANQDTLLAGDPFAARTWVQQMGRVRTPVSRLGRLAELADMLAGTPGSEPTVLQAPATPGARWIGLPPDAAASHPPGVAGIVTVASDPVPSFGGRLAGLLIDEWTEIVPAATETAAIAFQFDPPDAAPPQAILLAVPPVVGEPWRVGSLGQVLLETLELARLRAVGPDQLGAVAHFLPAAMLAFNTLGDTVSTDLNALT